MRDFPASTRLLAVASLALLGGCGSAANPLSSATPAAATSSPSATNGTPPSPSGTADASLAVHGTETCQIVDADYTGDPLRERFHCQEINTDVRLTGEWEIWIPTHQTGGGVGTWTAEFVMTNSGGTWRGTGSGTVTGMPDSPTNLGLLEWVGEGGYLGLVYHEFVYGSNAQLVTAGWVEAAPGA